MNNYCAHLLACVVTAAIGGLLAALSYTIGLILAIAFGFYSFIVLRSIPLEGDSARVLGGTTGALTLTCIGVLCLKSAVPTVAVIAFVAALALPAYLGYSVYLKKR